MLDFKVSSTDELPEVAQKVLRNYPGARIFVFYGAMGAGKTTFIKTLCEALGVEGDTSSPTYSLVNEYRSKNDAVIYHFDFYRIENEEQAYDIGYEDYFYSGDYCFIEWPERIENLLPPNYVSISISEENTERIIKVETC